LKKSHFNQINFNASTKINPQKSNQGKINPLKKKQSSYYRSKIQKKTKNSNLGHRLTMPKPQIKLENFFTST
jgi:hypothetical protein